MTKARWALACAMLAAMATAGQAAEISGRYLEARTCDVFTGPCVANSEVGLAGKEALMAWTVEKGSWKGVNLEGLSVAAAVVGKDTLGPGGLLLTNPFPTKSVIYVDEKANSAQREALVDFARSQSGRLLKKVVRVEAVPVSTKINRSDSRGTLTIGKVAKLQTRALVEEDSGHT